jgi:hypothetical protein
MKDIIDVMQLQQDALKRKQINSETIDYKYVTVYFRFPQMPNSLLVSSISAERKAAKVSYPDFYSNVPSNWT